MSADIALVDPERALALAHVPAACRSALSALWALDERLGTVVGTTREPMIGAIRLAWWREALERLDGAPPPDEPLLVALHAGLLPTGVRGAALETIVDGWEALLAPLPLDDAALETFASRRGDALWRLGAAALGEECPPDIARAGGGWALVDLAFRVSDRMTASRALALARIRLDPTLRWPRRLRPLGMLAMLARDDARAGLDGDRHPGAPLRIARMLWHRIGGS